MNEAIEKGAFTRDWRNRRIAHRDLDLAFGTEAAPLEAASRERAKAAIAALANVLNQVSKHYLESTTFLDFDANDGGAVSLSCVLDDGLKRAKERRERIRSGDGSADDFQRRDL